VALVIVAYTQLVSIDANQKKWGTLQACDRYDTDPLIQRAVAALDRGGNNDRARLYATRLLNYFDAIAIGLEQGFYDDKIAYAHIGRIVFRRFDQLTGAGWISKQDAQTDFEALSKLMNRWKRPD
jgi:hypothetical protein